MFLLLAITSFALLIGIGFILEKKKESRLSEMVLDGPAIQHPAMSPGESVDAGISGVTILPECGKDTTRVEGYALPDSLYYHQGHMWVALQDSGIAVIGMDEFAGKLLGEPTRVKLPRLGEICRQGARTLSLQRNEKIADVLSPLDGQVVAVNGRVIDDPGMVAKEPYGNGWLMMIKPRDIKRGVRNLISGAVARSWIEESAATLRFVFSGSLGPVYQDGGLPEDGLSDQMEDAAWEKLASQVFMLERSEDSR